METTMTLDLQQSEFVNTAALASYLGVSKMTITRMRRTGRLPLPAYVDDGVTLWASSDLVQWEQAGRPVLTHLAITSGPEDCAAADLAAADDKRNGPVDETKLPHLRAVIAEMRRSADACEAVLNSHPAFVKSALSADERQAIIAEMEAILAAARPRGEMTEDEVAEFHSLARKLSSGPLLSLEQRERIGRHAKDAT
jgi:predicted DNA-binding transcriptional regulator AlpA